MTKEMMKATDTNPTAGRMTKSQSQVSKAAKEQINTVNMEGWEYVFEMSVIPYPHEPKKIGQALKSLEKDKWKESAIQELKNFYVRKSWEIVDRQDAYNMGKNIIGSKWVFKKKIKPDGSIRYKSRVVSKGYMDTWN